ALGRFAAAVEAEARAALPSDARRWHRARLSSWDASDPALSRQWVEDDTRGLDGEARAGARLALLAALAPHQIDDGGRGDAPRDRCALRRRRASDRHLSIDPTVCRARGVRGNGGCVRLVRMAVRPQPGDRRTDARATVGGEVT